MWMYDNSVPVFKHMLHNVKALLVKAQTFCAQTPFSETELLSTALAPDMFSFARQIQIATDHAKGATCRLQAIDIPKFEDNEQTLDALIARVDKTLALLETADKARFADAAERSIELVFPWATYTFTGQQYLNSWALPNFYFHITTAYDILRHKGARIGKADFLGDVNALNRPL